MYIACVCYLNTGSFVKLMKNVANQCELDDSYHDFRISMKYRGNSFYSLVPIFVVSTKCIDLCDLEFVVLNTAGNNQWEHCISLDFCFRGLSGTTKSTNIKIPTINNDFTVVCSILLYVFALSCQNLLTKKFKQRWSTILPISTKRTITSHLNALRTRKRPRHMTLEIQVLVWDRHTNVAGLNRLMGVSTPSS